MTEWVQIKHPDLPKAPNTIVSVKAWLRVYKPMHTWKLVKPAKGDDK